REFCENPEDQPVHGGPDRPPAVAASPPGLTNRESCLPPESTDGSAFLLCHPYQFRLSTGDSADDGCAGGAAFSKKGNNLLQRTFSNAKEQAATGLSVREQGALNRRC